MVSTGGIVGIVIGCTAAAVIVAAVAKKLYDDHFGRTINLSKDGLVAGMV